MNAPNAAPFHTRNSVNAEAHHRALLWFAPIGRLDELPASQLGVMPLIQKNTNAYLRAHDDVMTRENEKPYTFEYINNDGGADGPVC
jgi:hypothetical protein